MLSESRITGLLAECKRATGSCLTKLAKDCDTPAGQWELIVLHAASQLAKVQHEPGDAMPDVQLLSASAPLWVEASYITPSKPATTSPLGDPADFRKHPEDHVVYRKVNEKGRQAKKWWATTGGSASDSTTTTPGPYEPLVLALGASERFDRIDPRGHGLVTLDQAVDAALLDASAMSESEYLNRTGQPALPRVRVLGSKRIAGVVVTCLVQNSKPGNCECRETRSRLFWNEQAALPLNEEQQQFVTALGRKLLDDRYK